MSLEITINPVGNIQIENERFFVSVKARYREGLRALEGFSHINILWWGHRADSSTSRDTLIVEKPYDKSPDIMGVFATRGEIRPNPILTTIAEVIRVDVAEGIIELPWTDAESGSPIIDIKPYHPCSDRVKNVGLPDWCARWPEWYEDSAEFDWGSVFNF